MATIIFAIITTYFFSLAILAQEHGSPYAPPSIITYSEPSAPTPPPPPILALKPGNDINISLPPTEVTSLPSTIPTDLPPRPEGPANHPYPSIPKVGFRSTSIHMCTNSEFGGKCETFTMPVGWCHNLPEMYRKQVSSVRMDEGQTCLVFDGVDCFGGEDWLRAPGSRNLRGRRFDNRIVSWRCQEDGVDGW